MVTNYLRCLGGSQHPLATDLSSVSWYPSAFDKADVRLVLVLGQIMRGTGKTWKKSFDNVGVPHETR